MEEVKKKRGRPRNTLNNPRPAPLVDPEILDDNCKYGEYVGECDPQRMLEVHDLLVRCRNHTRIQVELSKRWQCSYRTVRTYIKRTYELWAKDSQEEAPAKREQLRQTLIDFYNRALDNGEMGPAITALDRLIRVEGLYAPEKVAHAHLLAGEVSVMGLDPAKIRERIQELIEMRKQKALQVADEGKDSHELSDTSLVTNVGPMSATPENNKPSK